MVLVVWAGLMMVVGIWVTMRKIWETCRGVIESGREREPEAEPEREVEEQREEIRRRRPVFLGSPVPTPQHTSQAHTPETPAPSRLNQGDQGEEDGVRGRRTLAARGGWSDRRDRTPTTRSTPLLGSQQVNGQDQWMPEIPPFPQLASGSAGMDETDTGDFVPFEGGIWHGGMSIIHPPDLQPEDIPAGKGEPHPIHFGKGGEGRGKGKKGKDDDDQEDSGASSSHGGRVLQKGGKSRSSSFKGSPGTPSSTTTRTHGNPPSGDGGNAPEWRAYITRWGTKYHTSPRCCWIKEVSKVWHR